MLYNTKSKMFSYTQGRPFDESKADFQAAKQSYEAFIAIYHTHGKTLAGYRNEEFSSPGAWGPGDTGTSDAAGLLNFLATPKGSIQLYVPRTFRPEALPLVGPDLSRMRFLPGTVHVLKRGRP